MGVGQVAMEDMGMRFTADFIVIGGGVIGINIALELKRLNPGARVVLIEKEKDCGLHASGRNSGVLHAGFYYTADSLKARFTRDGNRLMTEYCQSKGIPVNRCGKLVVASSETDLPHLEELLSRAAANGIELQKITQAEARAIEPRVKTFKYALFSPATSTVDPVGVLRALKEDAEAEGVEVRCGVRYLARKEEAIQTSDGLMRAGYYVNAAGLYADRVAMDFGLSKSYRLLPFKGLYLYCDEPRGSIRTNIYPVPDLRNPFLGVHFTVTSEGRAKIGPTAIPAFWREQYGLFENFDLKEFVEITARELGMFAFSNFDFKRLACEELKKLSRQRMVALAGLLLDGVKAGNYKSWAVPGIRAQLVDLKEKKLVMDFVLEADGQSMHVLNAVSPAFTCSIPFARYIANEIAAHI